jgi:hypothetical protein
MNLKAKIAARAVHARGTNSYALNAHGHSSAVGFANAEHDIYDDDAISDYLRSGERINLQALRSHHPDKPSG